MEREYIPVIICGDYIAAYGTIRGLSQYDIPIYIVSKTGKDLATYSRFVKKTLQLDPKNPNCIEKLNTWFTNEIGTDAVLMVAGDDYFLDTLAKGHSDLLPSMKTTFPDWKIVSLVREKRRTYKIAEELGIPLPKTHYISCRTELQDLLEEGMEANFPILMRTEVDSTLFLKQYRTKGVVCNNDEELLRNYEKYNGFYGTLLIQEFISGNENNLFCLKTVLNKNSEPLAVFIDRKLRTSKQFSSCSLTTSTWSNQVVEYGLRLLKEIGYVGYASVEFKFDHRDTRFKLMEINGRISMNNSNALKCGINLPYLMYKEALNGPLPPLKECKQTYPDDILWWYPVDDLFSIYHSIRTKTFNPFQYIKSLRGRGYIIEPLNINDLKPFFSIPLQFFRWLKKR